MSSDDWLSKLMYAAMAGLGVVGLWLSTAQFVHGANLWQYGVHVEGEIVRVDKRTERVDGKLRESFVPTFTFSDNSGTRHEIVSSTEEWSRNYERGDPVALLYPAEQPELAEISAFRNLFLLPTFGFIIGPFLLLCGVLGLFPGVLRRRLDNEPAGYKDELLG